jgi:hypothetical protein
LPMIADDYNEKVDPNYDWCDSSRG